MDENTPSKLSVAKKSITDIDIFKTPNLPPLKKKKRVKVLDEDSYVEEMAKIIQRDFFPDLEKLKAQNEFLDATERKDYRKLRELYSKYSGGQKPPPERFASPATFETPHTNVPGTPLTDGVNIQNSNVGESQRSFTSICSTKSKNGISDKHSLDSFLAAYTSEDNNSFQDIMEEMGRKSRIKFAEQLQIEHESQLKSLMASNVPSIEEQADQYKQPEALDTWSYRAKNYIMYVPDGETSRLDCIDNTQEVVHTNTRMEIDPFDYQRSKDTITQIAKSQERILSGRIGVDGSTLLDNKSKQGGLNTNYGGLGGGTVSDGIRLLPMSSAHSLVRTPSPNPGAPGESPLMTWGQIEGTPFRLDGGDTPLPGKGSGTSFKMGVTSKREQIALSLAEKAGQRHRAQKKKAIEAAKRSMLTPSPRMSTGSTIERLASMSPAAQRLATSQLKRLSGIATPKLTPIRGSGNLTPSMSKVTTPIVSRRKPDTPLTGEDKRNKKNLTDDLLQINLPKRNRLKASDFFA